MLNVVNYYGSWVSKIKYIDLKKLLPIKTKEE